MRQTIRKILLTVGVGLLGGYSLIAVNEYLAGKNALLVSYGLGMAYGIILLYGMESVSQCQLEN